MKTMLMKCGIVPVLLLLFCASAFGAEADRPECSGISEDAERLECYDELFGRSSKRGGPEGESSCLEKRWELDESAPRGKYGIMAHRNNYLLPLAYNESPRASPVGDSEVVEEKKSEVKFQISLKTKLLQDLFGRKIDLWFGYTQRSFWQLYNLEESAPFRETNYEPELLFNFRTDFPLLGWRSRIFNLGLNHQSNGRSEPISRSWNRVVANLGLEKQNLVLLLKAWYRIPEGREDDDNRNIDDYLGPGELWGYYHWKDQRFGVMLRNNFHSSENRGAVQLEWSFPLVNKVGILFQYFNGYGESLLDYDHAVSRLGIGFTLTD